MAGMTPTVDKVMEAMQNVDKAQEMLHQAIIESQPTMVDIIAIVDGYHNQTMEALRSHHADLLRALQRIQMASVPRPEAQTLDTTTRDPQNTTMGGQEEAVSTNAKDGKTPKVNEEGEKASSKSTNTTESHGSTRESIHAPNPWPQRDWRGPNDRNDHGAPMRDQYINPRPDPWASYEQDDIS